MLNFHPAIFILILALVPGISASSTFGQLRNKYPGSLSQQLFFFSLAINLSIILRLFQYYIAGNIWPSPPADSIFYTMFLIESLTLYLYLFQLRSAFIIQKYPGTFTAKPRSWIFYPLISLPIVLSLLIKTTIVQHIVSFMISLPFIYLSGLLISIVVHRKNGSFNPARRHELIPDADMNRLRLFFLRYFSCLILLRFLLVFKSINHDLIFLLLPSHFLVFASVLMWLAYTLTKTFNTHSNSGKQSADLITRFCQSFQLSPKEKDILIQLCSGKSNSQIADHLFITTNTVKFHITHIYQKTEVKNRVQLMNLISNH